MKYLKLIVIILSATNFLFAQSNAIQISGTVVEAYSKLPVEFATVMIADKTTKEAITGVTTATDGTFNVLSNTSDFLIEISFIGLQTKTISNFTILDGKVQLGTIQMDANSQQLDEVIVQAEKSSTEFRLDKRVFNVGKDLSSTGASAMEVLNNVPSVNVNIEGEISLRGSTGVQILINGKPSVLASEQGNALGTITAEMIDRIEVITNPSAKYDAEGTSGIINIVIKKEERRGVNGSATINTGIPHNHSFGLSLNRRTEKFNLFTQLGVGYRELPNDREGINRDLTTGTTVISSGTEFRNETFYNLILGTDYHINDNNVLTLSGSYAYEVEDQPSQTFFDFTDESGEVISSYNRNETTEATNPKFQYELQYKSDFQDYEDHTLLISALGNFFGKKQASEFLNVQTLGSETFANQQTETDFQEGKYTFSIDYTKPFSDKITMETGAQYVINNVSNDFEVRNATIGEWVADENLTNLFQYDQEVLGVYGTGAYEDNKWGLKLGLRMENTALKTLLVNTDEGNDRNFTNFFPSLHSSYKISDVLSVQGGYSRRIFRPRLWDLNPFFNIRNNFSVRTGNPDLLPEFTDSYEVSSIYIANKASFNFGVYHRFTKEVVERVSIFENNINTVKPFNIGTNRSTGIECNVKYIVSKTISINGDLNYNYFNREGALNGTSFDFTSDQWSSKITSKIKFPKDFDFEFIGHFRSKYQTVQSEVSGNLFADLGLRKKVLKGKGVLNISIRDIFASRIRENETIQDDFYLYSFSQRGRFITLGFSYGFGKGEAMEFSGQKRR